MATSAALLACGSRPRIVLLQQDAAFSCSRKKRKLRSLKCSNSEDEHQQGSVAENAESNKNAQGPEQEAKTGTRMEVSSSVMKVLQGAASAPEGLIEANLRKRNSTREQKQNPAALAATSAFVREELFGNIDMCVPKHDGFFPLVVAAAAILNDESKDAEQALERFTDTSALRSAVAEDLERMQSKGMLPSQLFCDVNGEPLNKRGEADLKFERWFLLSMYVKFKLWWSGPSVSSQIGQEYAYRMSNFIFDGGGSLDHLLEKTSYRSGRRLASRYGKLFVGNLLTEPRAFLDRLQSELDKQHSDWTALLLKLQGEEAAAEQVACLVTNRTSIPFLELQGAAVWFAYLLLAWSVTSATLSFDPVVGPRGWEELVVGVAILGVVGSGVLLRRLVAPFHRVAHLLSAPPLVLPLGQQGAFPSCLAYYKGCLPDRACLFDLSAASTCASLATSAVFLFDTSINVQLADFRGCLLVPSDIFSYSPLLTWLLNKVALVTAADGSSLLVLNPLALGGLLGLNMTVLALLPLPNLDGGRIITALCGRRILRIVSGATFLLVTASLLVSHKFLLASLLTVSYLLVPEDSFQRDEVSEPGVLRTALGILLVLSAVLCFVPFTGTP